MKWAWVNDGRSNIAPWQKQGQVKAHLRMKRVPKARKDKKHHILTQEDLTKIKKIEANLLTISDVSFKIMIYYLLNLDKKGQLLARQYVIVENATV